ncbi:MAG: hypothetical protein JO316_09655 [Abitibacteriaceae bacterium]|nr:hypothetical protein [Abditibacteriaceae bacterium]
MDKQEASFRQNKNASALALILFRAKFLLGGILCAFLLIVSGCLLTPVILVGGWIAVAKAESHVEAKRYFMIGVTAYSMAITLIVVANKLSLLG